MSQTPAAADNCLLQPRQESSTAPNGTTNGISASASAGIRRYVQLIALHVSSIWADGQCWKTAMSRGARRWSLALLRCSSTTGGDRRRSTPRASGAGVGSMFSVNAPRSGTNAKTFFALASVVLGRNGHRLIFLLPTPQSEAAHRQYSTGHCQEDAESRATRSWQHGPPEREYCPAGRVGEDSRVRVTSCSSPWSTSQSAIVL